MPVALLTTRTMTSDVMPSVLCTPCAPDGLASFRCRFRVQGLGFRVQGLASVTQRRSLPSSERFGISFGFSFGFGFMFGCRLSFSFGSEPLTGWLRFSFGSEPLTGWSRFSFGSEPLKDAPTSPWSPTQIRVSGFGFQD